MRFQGRISDWKDDRGFGFITPNGGGNRVFLHIRSFRKGEPRPAGSELVTFVVAQGEKGARAEDVAYVDRSRHMEPTRRTSKASNENSGGLTKVIVVAMLIGLGVYGWQKFDAKRAAIRQAAEVKESTALPRTSGPAGLINQIAPATAGTPFKCEGKKYCSQMTSCEEAKFYLKNCPGMEMDGDNDGIPCESQWCKR